MGTLYVDTGGAATNSGSTNQNAANLSGAAATVAGSVISLDGSPDLTGVVIAAGATQSSIYLNDATNSNQKIFWITAVDNGAKTVTVSVAPTGVVSSSWAIGGRVLWNDAVFGAALRGGDQVTVNNSPAGQAGTFLTSRAAGDTTNGPVKVVGLAGAKRVLNATSTNPCLSLTHNYFYFENLEFDQDGATGNAVTTTGVGVAFYDCKVSDAGANGIQASSNCKIVNCEITGCGADGIEQPSGAGGGWLVVAGCHIHTNTGNGIDFPNSGPSGVLAYNVISANGGRGIAATSGVVAAATTSLILINNTIYGNGNSGLESSDVDLNTFLMNNIFQDNGNAAGEYNVEWTGGSAELSNGLHFYNTFYHAGGGGGANLSGLTAHSTDITTDPQMNNPSAGGASADFRLKSASPARGTGFPGTLPGLTNGLGAADRGALQRVEGIALGTGAYAVSAVTYQSSGGVNSVLPSASVYLIRLASGIAEVVDSDTSNAVTGAFTLNSPYNTGDHFVLVHKADTPHKFGVTDIEVTPA